MWYQDEMKKLAAISGDSEAELFKMELLLEIAKNKGKRNGKTIKKEEFEPLFKTEFQLKQYEKFVSILERKHPLLKKAKCIASDKWSGDDRVEYGGSTEEEVELRDLKGKYEKAFELVQKRDRARQVLIKLFGRYGGDLKSVIRYSLVTDEQVKEITEQYGDLHRGISTLFEEKNNLYKKFYPEWNEYVGFEMFLMEGVRPDIFPSFVGEEKVEKILKLASVEEEDEDEYSFYEMLPDETEEEYDLRVKEEVQKLDEKREKESKLGSWDRDRREIYSKNKLLLDYHLFVKEPDDIEQVALFVDGALLDEEQEDKLEKLNISLVQVLKEKGALYDSMRESWNEQMGFELFEYEKTSESRDEKIPLRSENEIRKLMGLSFEKSILIKQFEQELFSLNSVSEYEGEDIVRYLNEQFKEAFGEKWEQALEKEEMRKFVVKYYEKQIDPAEQTQVKRFVKEHGNLSFVDDLLKRQRMTLEEVVEVAGRHYEILLSHFNKKANRELFTI